MGRTRGCLWLMAGVLVAILAGVVAFAALNGAATPDDEGVAPARGGAVEVVVSVGAAPIGAPLTAAMLEVRAVDAAVAPADAVKTVEEAVGKITLVDLYAGEILVNSRLADPNVVAPNGRVALVLSEGQVLMALPAQDLLSRINVLKAGDRVDLLFSLEMPNDRTPGVDSDEELATFNLLQSVPIAAVVASQAQGGQAGEPIALLLTVSPQDALTLKYARDAGGVLDIVLRAPGDEQPVETEPVDVDYLINRYKLPTEVGR